jgi:hypothetical protein
LPQTAINARARDPMTCGYSHGHESASDLADFVCDCCAMTRIKIAFEGPTAETDSDDE